MSRIEEAVIKKIRQRAELGRNKYGTTMERKDLTVMEWLIHWQEENLDAAIYAEKLIHELLLIWKKPADDEIDK